MDYSCLIHIAVVSRMKHKVKAFSSGFQRKAKRPEGADQKTISPGKTLANKKCSTVALALPVCLSAWLEAGVNGVLHKNRGVVGSSSDIAFGVCLPLF